MILLKRMCEMAVFLRRKSRPRHEQGTEMIFHEIDWNDSTDFVASLPKQSMIKIFD